MKLDRVALLSANSSGDDFTKKVEEAVTNRLSYNTLGTPLQEIDISYINHPDFLRESSLFALPDTHATVLEPNNMVNTEQKSNFNDFSGLVYNIFEENETNQIRTSVLKLDDSVLVSVIANTDGNYYPCVALVDDRGIVMDANRTTSKHHIAVRFVLDFNGDYLSYMSGWFSKVDITAVEVANRWVPNMHIPANSRTLGKIRASVHMRELGKNINIGSSKIGRHVT